MSTRACWTITLDGHRADDGGTGSDLTSELRRPGDCAEADQTHSYSRRPRAVLSRSPICCAVGRASCLACNHAPRRGMVCRLIRHSTRATGSLTSLLVTPGHYGYSSRHDSQAVAHQRGWIASRSSSSQVSRAATSKRLMISACSAVGSLPAAALALARAPLLAPGRGVAQPSCARIQRRL